MSENESEKEKLNKRPLQGATKAQSVFLYKSMKYQEEAEAKELKKNKEE